MPERLPSGSVPGSDLCSGGIFIESNVRSPPRHRAAERRRQQLRSRLSALPLPRCTRGFVTGSLITSNASQHRDSAQTAAKRGLNQEKFKKSLKQRLRWVLYYKHLQWGGEEEIRKFFKLCPAPS